MSDQATTLIVHWDNPWDTAVPVPIDELAECHYGLGKQCRMSDGSIAILTKEEVLRHWREAGEKLDAYILPQPDGYHSIGVRYGNEGENYMSPCGDTKKVAELLAKYQSRPIPIDDQAVSFTVDLRFTVNASDKIKNARDALRDVASRMKAHGFHDFKISARRTQKE